jgi:hypothetical protein
MVQFDRVKMYILKNIISIYNYILLCKNKTLSGQQMANLQNPAVITHMREYASVLQQRADSLIESAEHMDEINYNNMFSRAVCDHDSPDLRKRAAILQQHSERLMELANQIEFEQDVEQSPSIPWFMRNDK